LYDNLGQVTSGKKYFADGTPVPGQQFEYGFDDIGNRSSTKAGGMKTAPTFALPIIRRTRSTSTQAVTFLGWTR